MGSDPKGEDVLQDTEVIFIYQSVHLYVPMYVRESVHPHPFGRPQRATEILDDFRRLLNKFSTLQSNLSKKMSDLIYDFWYGGPLLTQNVIELEKIQN